MKKHLWLIAFSLTVISQARADVPFTNIEGAGGVALNPVAYLAYTPGADKSQDLVSKPRFGIWNVNLSDVNVDWTSIGVTDTFFKRLEVSYAHETIATGAGKNRHKEDIGAKFLVLPENFNDLKFLPALSVGAISKHTSNVGLGVDTGGLDGYVVVTKLITQLPRPVLLSAGVLSTKGRATGVFGFDSQRKIAGFANIDVIVADPIVVGLEYKQGAKFNDFKNADYWNAHAAWLVNKNLSLIVAYVNAGDYLSTSKVGLGKGVVVSTQYSF
jgi:hypothetical protein